MNSFISRAVISLALLAVAGTAATLEKLSVEEMAQKSTLIVRGRVSGCTGNADASVIYTACTLAVSERWKGEAGPEVRFVVPGGQARGLVQTFSGAPKVNAGAEYVFFLWAGRSGVNQVIGLSQGVFGVVTDSKGQGIAQRGATAERMVDKSGNEIQDENLSLTVTQLRDRVRQALAGSAR